MQPVQPSASVASSGLGIRYVGNWVYGLSGQIIVSNDTSTQFDFTSGSGIIVGHYQFFVDVADMDDNKVLGFEIYFNDIRVIESKHYTSSPGSVYDFDNPINLIIPPFTDVKITASTNDASNVETYGVLTGRVYGTE